MKLRLGKMTNKELAEWFGMSNPKSFSNNRKAKLEVLKDFCEFEELPNRRGIIISEILFEEYSKDLDFDKLYHQFVLEQDNHITSAAGMARKLIATDERFKKISEDWLSRRFNRAGKRTYGETNQIIQEIPNKPGYCGSRKYVWAVKVDDLNNYRLKTPAEEIIYKQILSDYVDSQNAIALMEHNAMIDKMEKEGSITAEEARKARKDYNNFFVYVIQPFKETTGLQLANATEHEVYESMRRQGLEIPTE